jgi:hypothetical protein
VEIQRGKGLAEVATQKKDFEHEIVGMQMHAEQQEGCVVLNIGGYRFETLVQALRRVLHTFFDASFSSRYMQDVCDDGSIFVDRDGEHFGHALEYMRDGYVSVAEPGAHPSVSLLRKLKREFGYYCIELIVEKAVEPEQPEMAYVLGGICDGKLSSMERYDLSSGQWNAVASMGTARTHFDACAIAGELYVVGGESSNGDDLASVEKYSPSSDTWSAVNPLPTARANHAAIAVGSTMYVLGGVIEGGTPTASVHAFAACAIGNNIHTLGGCNNSEEHQVSKTSVYTYDTVNDEWSALAPMPYACSYINASVLGGLVYIGGGGDWGRKVLGFDPASGDWSILASTLKGREAACSFVLGDCLYAASAWQYSSIVATNQ